MKGQVWISAVLYIAIGIVAISLILGAGLPVVYRMRDRNTVMQTKELLHTFDSSIRQVSSEGLGSQRILDPVIIKGGKMEINDNEISWQMDTSAVIMEPCGYEGSCDRSLKQHEGNIEMYLVETPVEDEYVIHLKLNYGDGIEVGLDENSLIKGSLTGKYSILVRNNGIKDGITLKVS